MPIMWKWPSSAWKKRNIGDLTVYQASTISWLPKIVQGYTTRHGGVSLPPFNSLNLGTNVNDDVNNVAANRELLFNHLGFTQSQVAYAEQVHGTGIKVVEDTQITPFPGVDAMITRIPNILLIMFFADCVPIYIVDPLKRAIGLAHSGWRGTSENIAGRTVYAMKEAFDCDPKTCLAAIGPSISVDSYEVQQDVADKFRNIAIGKASGSSIIVQPKNEFIGTYSLDLRQVVYGQLLSAGIKAESIAVCDEDTYRNHKDFFSYRRDNTTGRNAAYLAIRND